MKTDYDIIIIGSGAGGGTLAQHLAPSGKSILILERGGWLKREPENWSAEEVFQKNRYVSADIWHDEKGKPFQPGTYHYVGGATKMYGAALYRLREGGFQPARALRRHLARLAASATTTWSPTTPRPSSSTRCTARAAKTPPSRPPARPIPFPPVSHEPRIQKLSDDLARAGYHPFHSPCGIMLNEANMPYSTCVRCMDCDGFPCVVHAKSDAEVLGRAARAGAPERHAPHPCEGSEAEHQRRGHRSDRSGGGARRATWSVSAAASSSSPAARPTRRSCC